MSREGSVPKAGATGVKPGLSTPCPRAGRDRSLADAALGRRVLRTFAWSAAQQLTDHTPDCAGADSKGARVRVMPDEPYASAPRRSPSAAEALHAEHARRPGGRRLPRCPARRWAVGGAGRVGRGGGEHGRFGGFRDSNKLSARPAAQELDRQQRLLTPRGDRCLSAIHALSPSAIHLRLDHRRQRKPAANAGGLRSRRGRDKVEWRVADWLLVHGGDVCVVATPMAKHGDRRDRPLSSMQSRPAECVPKCVCRQPSSSQPSYRRSRVSPLMRRCLADRNRHRSARVRSRSS
jgi:hypothetical protein